MSNRVIISAAGSGKTTYLVNQALIKENESVLITTYTEANEAEIKKKIIQNKGCIPPNITVLTWFTFLLKHGVRPYQDIVEDKLHDKKIGFYLSNQKSGHRYGTMYWGEKDFYKFYFTKSLKIYSDKISKFILRCNAESENKVIERICKIFDNIFIDEVQDLAGYDYELLRLLFKMSNPVLLVGDPRQVTYLTHPTVKYKKYSDGKLVDFITEVVNKKNDVCIIDTTTLNTSHRNNRALCIFSSQLYPDLPVPEPCTCCADTSIEHQGVFLVKPSDLTNYLGKYNPVQIRWSSRVTVSEEYSVINMGESKGITFDRVLLYPTKDMIKWICDNNFSLKNETRAKFYVGLTRSRFSSAIVYDFSEDGIYNGIEKYIEGINDEK